MGRINTLSMGEPLEVVAALSDREASNEDLRFALINALERIDGLTMRLDRAEGVARAAANTASCLANGIQPD